MPINTLEMNEAAFAIAKDAAVPSPPQPDVVEPTVESSKNIKDDQIHQEAIQ